LTYQQPQTISVDNAPTILKALGPLSFFGHPVTTYKTDNKFIIELKSTDAIAHLSNVSDVGNLLWKIQDLGRPYYDKQSRDGAWPKIDYWPSARLTIIFELATLEVMELKDVCFDALPFLRATLKLHAYKKVTIHLRDF
jgi:hypothetical protein